MLFGLGAGDGGSVWDDWAGLGGSGVGVTGLGEVGYLRPRPVIKAGYSGSGIETLSAGP